MIRQRKILSMIGVVLFVSVMVLSTIAGAAVPHDASLKFVLADRGEYLSQPHQTTVFGSDEYIHYDDGTNVDAIGMYDGGTIEGAIRITPTELEEYHGYNLTAVRWHHGFSGSETPPHSGTIKIYNAGTSTNPGSLITSEPFTVPSTGWFETPLSHPILLNTTKDIWVSIQITHGFREWPLGVAPGPIVRGKGGWLSGDGGVNWAELDRLGLDYNWNIWAKVVATSTTPLQPGQPTGPSEGYITVAYTFSTNTTDPDGDQVYYQWNWNDGTFSEWLGPYNSGVTMTVTHAWIKGGKFNITVRAKDIYDVRSTWSKPKTITLDERILQIWNITGGLFRVRAEVKNVGGVEARWVNWSITLNGGFILIGEETSGGIIGIPAGKDSTVNSNLIFGFGETMITVSIQNAEASDTTERTAFVFLFIIR